MPKKTTTLILILAAVTGILLFLAISETRKPSETPAVVTPTKKPVVKTAKVFFNPQNLDLSAGSASPTSTIDIMVDTGGAAITGVQTELQYDPKAITNVRMTPATDATSLFGTTASVLFCDVDEPTPGRISCALAISPTQSPKTGIGKVATLSFQKAINAPATTTINFLDKTLVTILGENESVLKESMPLNITLGQSPVRTAPQVTVPPAQ
jgi:hypothetical protein